MSIDRVGMSTAPEWDVFDNYPESTCECSCGRFFRSHARYSVARGLISRKPCPECGVDDRLRASRSDPETDTIGGKPR
jgi:hypothetical protein